MPPPFAFRRRSASGAGLEVSGYRPGDANFLGSARARAGLFCKCITEMTEGPLYRVPQVTIASWIVPE